MKKNQKQAKQPKPSPQENPPEHLLKTFQKQLNGQNRAQLVDDQELKKFTNLMEKVIWQMGELKAQLDQLQKQDEQLLGLIKVLMGLDSK